MNYIYASEFKNKNSFFPPRTPARSFVVHVQAVTEGNPKVEVNVSIEKNVLKLVVNSRESFDANEKRQVDLLSKRGRVFKPISFFVRCSLRI